MQVQVEAKARRTDGRLELGPCESQDGRKVVVGFILLGRYGVRYLDIYFHGWIDRRRLTHREVFSLKVLCGNSSV